MMVNDDCRQIISQIYDLLCRNFGEINCKDSYPKEDKIVEDTLKMLQKFIEEYNSYKEQLEGYSLTLEAHLEELSQTYEELSTMFSISKIFSKNINPYELMDDFLKTILNSVPSESAGIILFNNEKEEIFKIGSNLHWEKVLEFVHEMFKNSRKDVIISEPSDKIIEGLESFILVPVVSGEKLWGYVGLFNKLNGDFYIAADRKILESAAMQLGLSLRNYEYLKQEIERQRLQEQLNIAKNIQSGLLAKDFPRTGSFEIYAKTIPAIFVGGDYYDIVKREDGKYLIVFADVSGKSVPAALLMSSIRTIVRNFGVYPEPVLSFAKKINRMITNDTPDDQFTTMILMVFDPQELEAEICNAGHNPMIVVNENGVKKVEATGIPFGIIEDFEYETVSIKLKNNDLIFVYTDGISEARNVNGEEFGHDRIIAHLTEEKFNDVKTIVEKLIDQVIQFSNGVNQHDDITAMAIKIF